MPQSLTARMIPHAAADFACSVISFHEQVLGGHAIIIRPRKTADVIRGYSYLLEILQSFSSRIVLPFDAAAQTVFGGLHSQKIRIATMDLRIAAIALSEGLILLTRNKRDFGKVPGLTTEDWTV